jgi:peptidoglycan hydrolase CwlO-like protein
MAEEQFIYLDKIKELTVRNQDLENQVKTLEAELKTLKQIIEEYNWV